MITSKKRKRVTVTDKFVGGEPIIQGAPGISQLAKALSWYNYTYDPKIAKGYLVEYMKASGYSKEDVNKIKACPDSIIGVTATSLARLITNGMDINAAHLRFLRGVIQAGIDYETKTPTVEKEPGAEKVVSIRERIEAKANQVLTDFDNAVDVVLKARKASNFSAYDYYRKNSTSAPIARIIIQQYQPMLAELNGALGGDKELAEGYSVFTNKELKAVRDTIQGIIDDSNRYIGNKKVMRAPRKVKQKSATQVVSKMKYKTVDESLKLVSVAPHDIIKSEGLWVYNTKTKVLGHYIAESVNGLNVKGTTITGFDAEKSIGKRLRKPEEALKQVLSATKAAQRKILPALKTAENKLTGRINQDTILLKVIK